MTSLVWVNDKGISTRYIMQVYEGARSATGTLHWFYPFVEGEGGYCFGVVRLPVRLSTHPYSVMT